MILKGDPVSFAVSEHRFVSFDKTPIFYRIVESSLKPTRAICLIVHGMGEHGGRYLDLANYLAGLGICSYIPDLRGFGLSAGGRGCVRNFDDYGMDLRAVADLCFERESKDKLFVLAHSFGALAALSFFEGYNMDRIQGLILSSPNFGISMKINFLKSLIAFLLSFTLPNITLSNQVKPGYLTHDRQILSAYAKDPLIHDRISFGLYQQLHWKMKRSLFTASKIMFPALILQAGDDRIVSRHRTELFFEALGSPDKELEIYQGLFHEILNELNREEIFYRIGAWIMKH